MCPAYKIPRFLILPVCPLSRASSVTDTLDRTDGQAFLVGPQWTAPLISEPLFCGFLQDKMKVKYEIWILTIPIWGSREKEFPAESGRGNSVVFVANKKKRSSHQFPEGPALTVTSADLGTRASLWWKRALFAASRVVA